MVVARGVDERGDCVGIEDLVVYVVIVVIVEDLMRLVFLLLVLWIVMCMLHRCTWIVRLWWLLVLCVIIGMCCVLSCLCIVVLLCWLILSVFELTVNMLALLISMVLSFGLCLFRWMIWLMSFGMV